MILRLSRRSAARASLDPDDTRRGARMKPRLDFDAINRAALAAFPAVLARILPGGKNVDIANMSPQSDAAVDRQSMVRSRSITSTANGATLRQATRAATLCRSIAFVEGVSQSEAARLLAEMLGLGEARS